MNDFKSRFKPAFRRSISGSPAKPDLSPASPSPSAAPDRSWGRSSLRLAKSKTLSSIFPVQEEKGIPALPPKLSTDKQSPTDLKKPLPTQSIEETLATPTSSDQGNPRFVVEQASPERRGRSISTIDNGNKTEDPSRLGETDARVNGATRPNIATRRHSPISFDHSHPFPFHRLEEPPARVPERSPTYKHNRQVYNRMLNRKIWVKRPNAIATQVSITEDDLVDDVKDMILRKYANSLGRNFDPPDVSLKVVVGPRSSRHTNERTLEPDENISKILDLHYPGGQSIDEALLIDVPTRRTPKQSPCVPMPYYVNDDIRPTEAGTDYFPPMPVGPQSPHLPTSISVASGHCETGHVPTLPSPGATARTRHSERAARPRYGRQHTSSPTIISGNTQTHDVHKLPPACSAISSPPVKPENIPQRTATPPPRNASPRPNVKSRRPKKAALNGDVPLSPGLLGGSVPPINVLIVEDNIINLRLLEAFLKRLNVRWSTAMNGEIAVNKWRGGGFHLVLMDIQLPVMNGLEATKEIRRLERVNNIGVFVNNKANLTPSQEKSAGQALSGAVDANVNGNNGTWNQTIQEDDLKNLALFKSPVIIVALTASSLQSDRHEALAAGCNDFLTKPVNFDWLSRKVMEWGCMQALIDFDGWRKWKDFSAKSSPGDTKKAPNGPLKSPLMNGKQKKYFGIMDGGNSSSEEKKEKVEKGGKEG